MIVTINNINYYYMESYHIKQYSKKSIQNIYERTINGIKNLSHAQMG